MPLPTPGISDMNNQAGVPEPRNRDVIIPPPEIRSIIHSYILLNSCIEIADKTAEYVAKNGSAFEEIVMKSEGNNPKFSFMKQGDPYRAYFEEKVIEFARGVGK